MLIASVALTLIMSRLFGVCWRVVISVRKWLMLRSEGLVQVTWMLLKYGIACVLCSGVLLKVLWVIVCSMLCVVGGLMSVSMTLLGCGRLCYVCLTVLLKLGLVRVRVFVATGLLVLLRCYPVCAPLRLISNSTGVFVCRFCWL